MYTERINKHHISHIHLPPASVCRAAGNLIVLGPAEGKTRVPERNSQLCQGCEADTGDSVISLLQVPEPEGQRTSTSSDEGAEK